MRSDQRTEIEGGRRFAELLEQLPEGGEGAMKDLLTEAQTLAYRFSMLVCGNTADAEDAMQDALLQTYRHAEQIRQPEAFRTWLYRTVKNACLMSRRPRKHEPPRLLSLDDGETLSVADANPSPEDLASLGLTHARLNRALRSLSKNYRLVLFLRDVEGLSTHEVAKIVGISDANVKQRLHRARKMLRSALTENLDHELQSARAD